MSIAYKRSQLQSTTFRLRLCLHCTDDAYSALEVSRLCAIYIHFDNDNSDIT